MKSVGVETTQCLKSLMCAERVCLLFLFLRHDDVTPSWFRALESHVLRVLNGNGRCSGPQVAGAEN